ncbi:hypothetical protein A5792_01190 [Mycolicibacterium peregrinum]|uniref:DUF937 domain-containing protein n=1 Tax=Mycolicibacterium peregrinum TaxID=43304 RepID=A0A1A0RCY6_MYCPR|nr:DUF937 domain-containing protein [Mycolicibacterium peregrinum]OBB32355.1 hypothetical protein A5792_01190 [Mycolicibacterium peregrinum]
MAGLDDLFAQIPVADIASKLGADEGEVNAAIKTLVPALVGGVAENVQADNIDSSDLESAVSAQGVSGLLDGGVSVDQVDANEGNQIVSKIFGGNDSNQVASALAGTGAGGGDLIKKLLPILAPIVLAYIGKQFAQKNAAPAGEAQASGGGGLGDILGSILGGATGGGAAANNPLGSILGSVLGGGGGQNNAIGEILGGLLGGKK